jgi:carbamoyl-phosphate synthase large subunit
MKERILSIAKELIGLGYNLYATEHTADFLIKHGINAVTILGKISEPDRKPNVKEHLIGGILDLIINIPSTSVFEKYEQMLEDEYQIRSKAVELGIPVLTTYEDADVFVEGLKWLQQSEFVKLS